MPKIMKDEMLLSDVLQFIARCSTPNAAAAKLGVNRSTLWRFKSKGCALNRTRDRLREGLDKHGKNESQAVAVKPVTTRPGEDGFAEMRRFCNSLLALLDERDRRLIADDQQA